MARYIEAERLAKVYMLKGKDKLRIATVINEIELAPTADVALRKEVAREIILEIDTLICCHANGDIDDKRLYILFDELKKKYVEDE